MVLPLPAGRASTIRSPRWLPSRFPTPSEVRRFDSQRHSGAARGIHEQRRKRKGLSKKARKGLTAQFTGVDDPYEAPSDLELNVDTVEKTPAEPAKQILDHLAAAGLLSGGGG